MAEFKTIKGFKTQSYATDPVAATAAWSSGGALPTAVNNQAGFGIQTAAVSAGGYTPGGATNNVQTYNGTAWTEVNNMTRSPTEYANRGAGTTAAGVTWGGTPTTGKTEKWDGTSWTASGVMNTARYGTMATGTQTAALCGSGVVDPPITVNCETFNGSTWTEINNVNTARRSPAGGGTTTAAIIFGGGVPTTATADAETWNGTSWSEGNNLNTARGYAMGTGDTVPTTIAFGGDPTTAKTETYDGTSWTEVGDMATARADGAGAGTGKTSALCIGGEPPRTTATEEWNDYSSTNPAPSLTMLNEGQIWYNTDSTALKYTAGIGAWTSGTNMPAGYNGLGGFGTATAATMAGSPAPTGFEYDGTTWTTTPALNTSGAPRYYPGSLGTSQSAGMIIGGEPGVAVSETWNGSAWSEGSNINTGRNFMGGCGITTAGIIAGGLQPSLSAKVETYNGTSWAEAQDVPTSLSGNQMGGTSTAAISVSGMDTAPNTVTAVTNEWDGTSWTAVNSVNTARDMMGGDGPTIATTLIYGGQVPPSTKQTLTEKYNGTSWTEVADLSTGRRSYGSAGNSSASVFTGGDPSPAGQTEEWTIVDTVKTVTVS